MRNATYILDNYIIDELELAAPAQVGVDLTLATVNQVGVDPASSFAGRVSNDLTATRAGVKADFALYTEIEPKKVLHDGEDVDMFSLEPGVYSIGFDQGLKNLGDTDTAFIVQRSTLIRNGAEIRSSVYDPGFGTANMGAMLYVWIPIQIEKHARVAQIIMHENERTDLYDGSYNNENDFR